MKLNQVQNVIALKLVLYDFDGRIYFSQGGGMRCQIIEVAENDSLKHEIPSIEVAKIETIDDKFNNDKVDFIKMDIEGSELAVLKSY